MIMADDRIAASEVKLLRARLALHRQLLREWVSLALQWRQVALHHLSGAGPRSPNLQN